MKSFESVEKFIKEHDWFKIGRWRQPGFFIDIISRAETEKRNDIALPYEVPTYLHCDFNQFITKEDYEIIFKKTQTDLLENPKHIFREIRKEIYDSIDKLNRFIPNRLDAKSLMKLYKMLINHGRQSFRFIILGYVLEKIFPSTLPKIIKLNNEGLSSHKLLAIAALPKKKMPMMIEHTNLLRIASRINKKHNVVQDLKSHVKKFSWMSSLCWWEEPITYDRYLIEAKQLSRQNPDDLIKQQDKMRQIRHQYANKLLVDLKNKYPKAFLYLDMIREMADLREESWDAVSIAGVRLRKLFQKLAKKYFLSYNQFMMLTVEEMLEIMNENNNPDAEELNRRMDKMMIFRQNGRSYIFSGKKAERAVNLAESIPEKSNQLKGLTIWPGRIRGIARVMKSTNDLGKMKLGEILICPMTDPDYMPAIKMAAALVAEQGGVLCHAAIVARELQKICIVGTKIATKIFKDGDLIEVDAERGIVRKVKSLNEKVKI